VSVKAPLSPLERLTERERAALDLVLRRQSSKEIARRLEVSPKRVDQLLDRARLKLDSPTRFAAAERYAELAGVSERLLYQPFPVPNPSPVRAEGAGVPADAVYTMGDAAVVARQPPWVYPRPSDAPKFWERDLGTASRLALIIAGTIGLLAAVLLGLGVAEGLKDLIRGG
jgi:DNA-binding CsgD family transcriptional regulator